jgi:hypothetical protein
MAGEGSESEARRNETSGGKDEKEKKYRKKGFGGVTQYGRKTKGIETVRSELEETGDKEKRYFEAVKSNSGSMDLRPTTLLLYSSTPGREPRQQRSPES